MSIGMRPEGAVVHLEHNPLAPLPMALSKDQTARCGPRHVEEMTPQQRWTGGCTNMEAGQRSGGLGRGDDHPFRCYGGILRAPCGDVPCPRFLAELGKAALQAGSGTRDMDEPRPHPPKHHAWGRIKTDHRLICFFAPGIGEQFFLPDATVDSPAPMALMLNHNLGPTDAMHASDLQMVKPARTDAYCRTHELRYLSSVSHLVSPRHVVAPEPGHPAYNMAGPAPSIARQKKAEGFFGGPFGIWIGPEVEPRGLVCQSVRRHKLLRLFGLGGSRVRQVLAAPWDQVVEQMRCMPAIQALVAVFAAVWQAETVVAAHGGNEDDQEMAREGSCGVGANLPPPSSLRVA